MNIEDMDREVERLGGVIKAVLQRAAREAAEEMREAAAKQVKKFPALAQRVRALPVEKP